MKAAAFLGVLSLTALLGWQRLPPATTDAQICVWLIVPICRDIAPKIEPIQPIKCHEVSR